MNCRVIEVEDSDNNPASLRGKRCHVYQFEDVCNSSDVKRQLDDLVNNDTPALIVYDEARHYHQHFVGCLYVDMSVQNEYSTLLRKVKCFKHLSLSDKLIVIENVNCPGHLIVKFVSNKSYNEFLFGSFSFKKDELGVVEPGWWMFEFNVSC